MLRVEVTIGGAFFDFAQPLLYRFAHFKGHRLGTLVRFFAKLGRNRSKVLRSLRKWRRLPFLLRNPDVRENRLDLTVRMPRVGGDFLSRRGIDADERRRG